MSENSSRRRSNSGNKGRTNSSHENGSNHRGKAGHLKAKAYQRTTSYDKVRTIVKEEGRMARNLITWNVPMDDSDDSDGQGGSRPKRKPRPRTPSKTAPKSPKKLNAVLAADKRSSSGDSRAADKSSSGSSDSKKMVKKVDMRARYWAFLFDNLQRAVDEIYQTCEADESIVECKEVIMILSSATQDFEALIKRINIQKDFENADKDHKPTSLVWEVRKSLSSPAKNRAPSWPGDARLTPNRRPTSLAWEVRKSSPSRLLGASSPLEGRIDTPSPVNRSLNFGERRKSSPVPMQDPVTSGPSWADRVKGKAVQPTPRLATAPMQDPQTPDNDKMSEMIPDKVSEEVPQLEKEDEEGWETVQRGKPNRTRPSSAKKTTPSRRDPGVVNKETHPRERADSEKENKPEIVQDYNKRVEEEQGKERVISNRPPKPDIRDEDPIVLERGREIESFEISDKEVNEQKFTKEEEELATKLDSDGTFEMDEEDKLTEELEKCHVEALASAIAEEETLNKEIQETESTEIHVETDEGESDLGNTLSSLESSQRTLDWNDLALEYERSSTMSWAEMVDDTLEAREPGHALHMHEKLSSPSRKRSIADAQKRHEERQARAQRKREEMLDEKNKRLKQLHERIQEVTCWKNHLISQRKDELDRKQKKAEEKRQVQLQMVVKKAQEEEAKANEIAFINSLEAQNKRHDIMARHMGHEARYNDILEERQRKNEEKAAKEEAVQERKKQLEEERIAKLEAMLKHRKEQEVKLVQLKDLRDQARMGAIKEKARDREERISALQAAQLAKEEEIQKKIQQKHVETARRHTQLIEQKRERAMELSTHRHKTSDSAPQQKPYEKKKLCSLCNVLIPSEVYLLSHLKGKKHRESVMKKTKAVSLTEEEVEHFSVKFIMDAATDQEDPKEEEEKERQRSSRKRARKLRQRMTAKGKEYENNLPSKSQLPDSQHKAKLQKLVKDMNKYLLQQNGVSVWEQGKVQAMDRALGEIARILEKKDTADQIMFRSFGGLTTLSRILFLIDTSNNGKPSPVPQRTICNASNSYRLACRNCYDNCQFILYSSKLGPIIDLLMYQLTIMLPNKTESPTSSPRFPVVDSLASSLVQLTTSVLNCLIKQRRSSPTTERKSPSSAKKKQSDVFDQWAQDIIGYIVNCGILDRLTDYFHLVQGPVDNEKSTSEFLHNSLGLLSSITRFSASTMKSSTDLFNPQKDDPTHLLATLKATGLGGIISLLYGILLHGGTPARGSSASPPELPETTVSVVSAGIKLLTSIAAIDLSLLQATLGAEGISLEFRHIATYLIWYCSHFTSCEELLHEVVLIVGYFTVQDYDNQMLIQSGHTPTLLQQLCSLPFQYFSDPRLMCVLFPTLICCCYGNQKNKTILEQEMSCSLLVNFIEDRIQDSEDAKSPTASGAKEKEKEREGSSKMGLEVRFPETLWDEAVKFFKA